jgi:hypothetical protein
LVALPQSTEACSSAGIRSARSGYQSSVRSPVLRSPANRHRAIPLTYDQFKAADVEHVYASWLNGNAYFVTENVDDFTVVAVATR